MVRLLLAGSNNLIALGATSVDVSIKKISNRNTKSDMDAMLKSIFRLFLDCIAMIYFFAGSCKTSINSVARASRINTSFSMRATRML